MKDSGGVQDDPCRHQDRLRHEEARGAEEPGEHLRFSREPGVTIDGMEMAVWMVETHGIWGRMDRAGNQCLKVLHETHAMERKSIRALLKAMGLSRLLTWPAP